MAKSTSKKKAATHLKLSLRENAYSFLNQSLRHYRRSSRKLNEWPFAMLHLTQALELLVKEALRGVHPRLILEDVDARKADKTVSLEQGLERLELFGVPIDAKERVNIARAARLRGQVVHHDVELNRFEWQNIYAQLFEFVHFFHQKHLKLELHREIAKENWPVEARLMLYFRENFIVYNGVQMHKANPRDILNAQQVDCLMRDLTLYRRIRFGNDVMWEGVEWEVCPDCGVQKGQFHVDGCDIEECPRCRGQLLGCLCFSDGAGDDGTAPEGGGKAM
jgi:hypothetical protein